MKTNSISLEGSAKRIKQMYPEVYEKFVDLHRKHDGAVLTEYTSSAVSRTRNHSVSIRLDNNTLRLNVDRRVNASWKSEVVTTRSKVESLLDSLLSKQPD